ncbi:MAG: hypothetical protein SGPRY_013275, partial [Prymnesium sp.]
MACSGDSWPRLAVLGVLSTEERLPLRSAIRRTWAPVLAEAASQGDVVLVRAPARAERAKGPLLSLFLWFRCALVAWPAARMIGKADDDIWVNLTSTAAMLQHSLRSISLDQQAGPLGARFPPPRVVWAERLLHEQMQNHAELAGSNTCRRNRCHQFAKGPMYFISSPMVKQVLEDSILQKERASVLHSLNDSMQLESIKPWEVRELPKMCLLALKLICPLTCPQDAGKNTRASRVGCAKSLP